MLSRFRVGEPVLPPLVLRSFTTLAPSTTGDARLELSWGDKSETFRFILESKSKATPQAIQLAIMQARNAAQSDELPMIQVPYLSPDRLDELERMNVSGVDLCGNGLVIIPGRLCVLRSGAPNLYPDSRPLNNPYRGRSAMVARMLFERRAWPTLSELATAIRSAGAELSLSQVSKAVQAMQEDLITARSSREIILQDPPKLLDRLGREWRRPNIRARQALRLQSGYQVAAALSASPILKWAYTGETSAPRYAMFSQAGARAIAVSSLPLAQELLRATPENVRNFADIELMETDEAGYYFNNDVDPSGNRWASRVQTWLELQAGDPRQQDVAKDLRTQILSRAQP